MCYNFNPHRFNSKLWRSISIGPIKHKSFVFTLFDICISNDKVEKDSFASLKIIELYIVQGELGIKEFVLREGTAFKGFAGQENLSKFCPNTHINLNHINSFKKWVSELSIKSLVSSNVNNIK